MITLFYDWIIKQTVSQYTAKDAVFTVLTEQGRNLKFIIIISITVLSVIVWFLIKYYSKRLDFVKTQMRKAAACDFNLPAKLDGNDEISAFYDDMKVMICNIKELITEIIEEQAEKELKNSRQKEIKYKMSACQINPHFLYNTLETIRMKARCNGEKEIEELVKMLAKIMRRNNQAEDKPVTLKSELELVEYYLKIQQYRFGERIDYNIDLMCDIEDFMIMPMIIQPVVEITFNHGLETKEGKGRIDIAVKRRDCLRINIIDNGVGIPQDKLIEIKTGLNDTNQTDYTSIGLKNVNQRIKLLYGEKYGISIESQVNLGTTVTIELPWDMK
jgi:two-component system sensor histidine kinase YesM